MKGLYNSDLPQLWIPSDYHRKEVITANTEMTRSRRIESLEEDSPFPTWAGKALLLSRVVFAGPVQILGTSMSTPLILLRYLGYYIAINQLTW